MPTIKISFSRMAGRTNTVVPPVYVYLEGITERKVWSKKLAAGLEYPMRLMAFLDDIIWRNGIKG